LKKSAQQLLATSFQLLSAGQLEEARRACRKALQARPDLPEAHLLFSEIHHQAGDAAKARESADRALRLRPGWSEAYVALGNAEALAGNLEPATAHFRAAIAAGTPGAAALQLNVALITAELGRSDEAAALLARLVELEPSFSAAREHLLRLLHASRRFAEMEAVARQGIALHPGAMVYARQLGVALWWQERHEAALAAFDSVERLAPDRASPAYHEAKLEQALSLLTLGRLREGWQAYQWRPTRIGWRLRHPDIAEDPRAIARAARIRILGEQGLGDDLFFLRFAPALRSRGHSLRGSFDQRLVPILTAIPGLFDRLTTAYDIPVEADATLLSGDLPLAAGQELAPPLPLRVDAERRARFAARMAEFGAPPYVGVTWRAGALPEERKDRGIFYLVKEVPPAELGAALRPIAGTFCVLQRKPAPGDQERFVAALGRPALDLSAVNDDLGDALAVLSVLDDYVGVSNTNTHLRAGCPGKPARVLVPANPEWRWGLRGARSPWFPGFSLYREDPREGWAPALEQLRTDLSAPIAA
jgi:tetratricopeptide (TPR) repeat protein